ncbi:hypothetical protein CHCC5022_4034 [Bacillus paralicheniformis]|nr:hypothetical protein DJ88_2683 [Bacillus paralicheniformis]TWJ65865.1 hypothetical protein CHCC5022_4034 [Bacillus paralicheniformis]TWJ73796.1 hypothetical protein CHCC4186_2196 [Bacillus paralicheniformis]
MIGSPHLFFTNVNTVWLKKLISEKRFEMFPASLLLNRPCSD